MRTALNTCPIILSYGGFFYSRLFYKKKSWCYLGENKSGILKRRKYERVPFKWCWHINLQFSYQTIKFVFIDIVGRCFCFGTVTIAASSDATLCLFYFVSFSNFIFIWYLYMLYLYSGDFFSTFHFIFFKKKQICTLIYCTGNWAK